MAMDPTAGPPLTAGGCRRVHIIGIPGSGKSTLARECAARLGSAVVNLDYLTLDDPRAAELVGAERYDAACAAAAAVAGRERWVTEGIYCGWTAPLLDLADLIIWLDTPPLTCVWRILVRHARLSLAHENNFPGLRLLARFAWGVLRDSSKPAATTVALRADMNANSRATTAAFLSPYRDKVLRCRTRDHRAALRTRMTTFRTSG
jgi:adenylate kinase family enzyme